MSELNEALRQLAEVFETLGVECAVMGGIAVRVYGIPRLTYDIDFTAAVARRRLPDLFRAVEEWGYSVPEA